jgi:hypothetical protein
MTKEHLATLTYEELIDLVLRLQARVTELEVELANKNRPPKTSSNSSVPPSSERKRKQNTKKKQGAKPGHVGQPGWDRT